MKSVSDILNRRFKQMDDEIKRIAFECRDSIEHPTSATEVVIDALISSLDRSIREKLALTRYELREEIKKASSIKASPELSNEKIDK